MAVFGMISQILSLLVGADAKIVRPARTSCPRGHPGGANARCCLDACLRGDNGDLDAVTETFLLDPHLWLLSVECWLKPWIRFTSHGILWRFPKSIRWVRRTSDKSGRGGLWFGRGKDDGAEERHWIKALSNFGKELQDRIPRVDRYSLTLASC